MTAQFCRATVHCRAILCSQVSLLSLMLINDDDDDDDVNSTQKFLSEFIHQAVRLPLSNQAVL